MPPPPKPLEHTRNKYLCQAQVPYGQGNGTANSPACVRPGPDPRIGEQRQGSPLRKLSPIECVAHRIEGVRRSARGSREVRTWRRTWTRRERPAADLSCLSEETSSVCPQSEGTYLLRPSSGKTAMPNAVPSPPKPVNYTRNKCLCQAQMPYGQANGVANGSASASRARFQSMNCGRGSGSCL